jgi:hypothetical protein
MSRDRRRAGTRCPRAAAAALACAVLFGSAGQVAAQADPRIPKPTVSEVFTMMGQYVRVAYNNEGYVTLGYQNAQRALGEEWLMLEVGLTMRKPAKDFTLKREHFTLKTPDDASIALASQSDYAKAGYLSALNNRAKVVRDSINYFPMDATRGCPMQFFANTGSGGRMLAFDQVELSYSRACVGRLYFHVPGGIKTGQHWLNVKFAESEVQVPFRILTKAEEKELKDSWEDLKKAHEASYK